VIRVLFSSAGRRVALINCFRAAARELRVDLEVMAVDASPDWSPACQVADRHFAVPRCTDPTFVGSVMDICSRHRVDLIIPTIDTELAVYSLGKDLFAGIKTAVLVGNPDFIRFARDKEETVAILREKGIPTPHTATYRQAAEEIDSLSYPVILKPRAGSCSVGITVAHSAEDFRGAMVEHDQYLVQELCTGREFTVNCFFDHGCVSCVPHFRKFVRAGEVCFAQTERVPGFKDIGDRIGEIFPDFYGPLCFQGFEKEGEVRIFEVNARFGGGYPICDYAGGTFARWILQKICGMIPDYHNDWHEGVRMLRYDEAVFTGAG